MTFRTPLSTTPLSTTPQPPVSAAAAATPSGGTACRRSHSLPSGTYWDHVPFARVRGGELREAVLVLHAG